MFGTNVWHGCALASLRAVGIVGVLTAVTIRDYTLKVLHEKNLVGVLSKGSHG